MYKSKTPCIYSSIVNVFFRKIEQLEYSQNEKIWTKYFHFIELIPIIGLKH